MSKEFIFFSILLFFMVQSSFALEFERKIYKPNNNTYEIPYVKPRKLFNITFNSSKIIEPPRRIFNAYNPFRRGYYTDRNRYRKKKICQKMKCNKGYEPISNKNRFGKSQCSCEKEKRCPFNTHKSCDGNGCKCISNININIKLNCPLGHTIKREKY